MTAKEFVKSKHPSARAEKYKQGRIKGIQETYWLIHSKEGRLAEGKTESNAWVNAKKNITFTLYTNGGYEVKSFKVLKEPIKGQFPDNNILYEGYASIDMNGLPMLTKLQWNKFGRVNNSNRWHDCNISTNDIMEILTK